jgi:diadenylate cyclase
VLLSDRVRQLWERLAAYPLWQVFLELLVIWVAVYFIVRLIHGTRAAGVLKTVVFFIVTATLLIRILGQREALSRLEVLYDNFIGYLVFGLIVVFQPELRRGLTRMGETSLFRRVPKPETVTVEAVVEAARFLSRARFGGLIVLERTVPLKNIVEGGTPMDAVVSARLLQTIFFPGSALHDLAVLVKGDRIRSAGVQLPLAEAEDVGDANLGSRHRAALGVTQESDAVAVVVSEETGTISIAERGQLTRGLTEDELRGLLILKLNKGLVSRITRAAEDAPEGAEAGDAGADSAGESHDNGEHSRSREEART